MAKKSELSFAEYEANAASTVTATEKWDQINRVVTPELTGILRRQVTLSRSVENYKKAGFHGKNLNTFPEVNRPAYALEGNINYQLLHGIIGVAGESGETIEVLLDAIEKGEPVDLERLAEELGDLLWYMSRAAEGAGTTLEEIARKNNTKLAERHAKKLAEAEGKT